MHWEVGYILSEDGSGRVAAEGQLNVLAKKSPQQWYVLLSFSMLSDSLEIWALYCVLKFNIWYTSRFLMANSSLAHERS